MLDFRLTARRVRKDKHPEYTKSLTIFGCDKDGYSLATWRFFWSSCVFFAAGIILLIASIAFKFADKL